MEWNDEFDWDANNEDKIAEKHGIDRYEAEQAARDPRALYFRKGTDKRGDNSRFEGIGKTMDGRILFFVVDRKGSGWWRIGSCRDAAFPEKRRYRQRNQ